MVPVIAGWAFVSFIYFKVVIDAAFYQGLSVVAALLMSIILGGLIFFLSGVYAIRLASNRVSSRLEGAPRRVFRPTVLPMVLASGVFALVSRMVVFGFSKRLNNAIEIFTGYRNRFNDDFVLFALLVAVPIIVHYCMVLFSQRSTQVSE